MIGDYTEMSAFYDLIMTSGYYDYERIANSLAKFEANTVLEIGCGTGLVLERLAEQRPDLRITGVDLTAAMLEIAEKRLTPYAQVTTHLGDVVTMSLKQDFDLAFSYGGVWYFSRDDQGDLNLVSHLRGKRPNHQGLRRIGSHLSTGGTLLLGIQGPHRDYATEVKNGMRYEQTVLPIRDGFRKGYFLADNDDRIVMRQVINYRTYPFKEALKMLQECGFEFWAETPLFLEFKKV